MFSQSATVRPNSARTCSCGGGIRLLHQPLCVRRRFSLLTPILKPCDAALVRMSYSRQTVDAFDHVRQQNFMLQLHMSDQFHGLRQRPQEPRMPKSSF